MNNVIEFAKGDRKVLVSKDLLALTGAVLGSLAGKSSGSSRFGVLKDKRVGAVLLGNKITNENKQVEQISNVFKTLEGKGIITLSGDKVQTAALVSEYADLAKEVAEAAGKVELAAPTAKRGRPAGSGAGSQGSTTVKRNPTVSKGIRYWLVGGKVTPFGRGKPGRDKLLAECDEKGKSIADVAAVDARFPAKVAGAVRRNPTMEAKLRYWLNNGTVTPFGRGKPGFDKLSNECTQAGEKIDNSALVAAMRQPKAGGSGNGSKVAALEAQLSQMQEMMAKMMAAMAVGAVAVPAAAVATEAPKVAQEKPVEAPKPAKVKAETPKAEKPVKPKASKPKQDKAPKVEKVKASSYIDENDVYAGFANVANDLGDDDPIAFGSDGFVVTDLD